MKYTYQTSEIVCPRTINFEIDEEGKIRNVQYLHGGCPGNLQAVPILVEGMKAEDVVKKLKGINCAGKGTSCANELAIAIEKELENRKNK